MRWIHQRLVQSVVTLLAVITITFTMIRFIPGGPMDFIRAQLAAQGRNPSEIQELVEVYTAVNPDKPLYMQYLGYLNSLAHGDMGKSVFYAKPVSDILVKALPWTVYLMATSLLLVYIIGLAFGAMMAYKEGSKFDTSLSVFSIVSSSAPYYVAAILLVFLFGYQLSWFPISGRVSGNVAPGFNFPFIRSVIYHSVLPISAFVLTRFGSRAVNMRGNSISVLGSDYIYVARLRGLPTSRIALTYVGRNAVLPMYTGLLISIGFMFGGAIVLERIFSYPGVGYYMFRSISTRDHSLMMGAFLIISIAVVIAVFIADATYGMIDPRADVRGEADE